MHANFSRSDTPSSREVLPAFFSIRFKEKRTIIAVAGQEGDVLRSSCLVKTETITSAKTSQTGKETRKGWISVVHTTEVSIPRSNAYK